MRQVMSSACRSTIPFFVILSEVEGSLTDFPFHDSLITIHDLAPCSLPSPTTDNAAPRAARLAPSAMLVLDSRFWILDSGRVRRSLLRGFSLPDPSQTQ